MAPFKKPLFVPPPPTTLDQFFAKADASSSAAVAPKRVKKVKAGLSSSRIKHTPAEIIILDSDDDHSDAPVPVPVVRKRKAKDHHRAAESRSYSSSSDIEVVEMDEGNGKKSKTVLFPAAALDESLHFAEFGKPKLLIDENSVGCCIPEDGVLRVPTSSTICLEDEWGTGDDERNLKGEFDDVLELTDDDEVEDVLKFDSDDTPPSRDDNNLDQCPFCSRSLSNLSPLVSFPFFCKILPSLMSSRIYNHTLMTVATPFLVHHHHHHGSSNLNAKSPLTAMRSLSSCHHARRTTHRRKLRWPRASARRKRTGASGEKRHSTRSCRACRSPSMLSVMV